MAAAACCCSPQSGPSSNQPQQQLATIHQTDPSQESTTDGKFIFIHTFKIRDKKLFKHKIMVCVCNFGLKSSFFSALCPLYLHQPAAPTASNDGRVLLAVSRLGLRGLVPRSPSTAAIQPPPRRHGMWVLEGLSRLLICHHPLNLDAPCVVAVAAAATTTRAATSMRTNAI